MSMFRAEAPTFDNTVEGYKTFKRKCAIYRARMKIEKKEMQVALSILGNLTGIAWATCEKLADNPDNLETADAYNNLMKLLDERFEYTKITQLPDAFEEYFFKANRKPREQLSEYILRQVKLTRAISEFDIILPDLIQGWLMLRRAGTHK